jgi:serine/threonine protein kinase
VNPDEVRHVKTELGPAPRRRSVELDDPRVIAALDEYLADLEAGRKPDRRAFLAKHADLAEALTECLDGMEALHQATSAPHQPAAGWTAPADCQPDAALGDFRIIREIGRGGMGVVYEAEQLSLGRRIALKVLPFALTLDPRQLQRFKNEARAAAQLHHPHIVPVYFVGSERGVHFYAMQFIEGQSLADLIHGLRQIAGRRKGSAAATATPARRKDSHGVTTGPYLPPSPAAAETVADPVGALATAYSTNSAQFYRHVARLGMQAAEALEHAHQYGVVHRDVKPGNLLLDAGGDVWVTDFGLAQFQADGGLTQTGDLLGTLRYMSPEQALGQRGVVDQRTDVYSLGATLYELLTLRPPFEGADRQTLLRQIGADEPRPPRAVEPSVPRELETIVLKALAKAPAERYATARDLADDLRRFLEHQPIRARPATLAQRAWKWARRHPSLVAAVVVVSLLTAVGSLIAAALLQGERARTQAAYERERQRAQEAEERLLLGRDAVEEMLELCENELADRPEFDGVRKRLLEDALIYSQKLIEQARENPAAHPELDAVRARAERILTDLTALQGDRLRPLLGEPAVLDDLGLGGEQRQQIADLKQRMDREMREAFQEFFRLGLPEEERHQRFLALIRGNDAELKKMLAPEKLRRLRQIDVQLKGRKAFDDSKVTVALKLTTAQKDRIKEIQHEAEDAEKRLHDWPKDRPRPADSPEQISAGAVEKIKALLTEEQARRWKEMTGEPFKGKLLPRAGPPFGHPDPRRDRRGPGPDGPGDGRRGAGKAAQFDAEES